MKLTVNGEIKIINSPQRGMDLDLAIKELGYNPKLIVIEFNGSIIDPIKWKKQIIKEGDQLEIVTIVGGGAFI